MLHLNFRLPSENASDNTLPRMSKMLSLFYKEVINKRMFIIFLISLFNPLSANFTKWSNKLKQFVGKLPTNCLSVVNHFVRLVHKELMV